MGTLITWPGASGTYAFIIYALEPVPGLLVAISRSKANKLSILRSWLHAFGYEFRVFWVFLKWRTLRVLRYRTGHGASKLRQLRYKTLRGQRMRSPTLLNFSTVGYCTCTHPPPLDSSELKPKLRM